MQIPELLHSLTLAGLSLATEPDGRLSVIGPVEALTVDQRRALNEHSEPLLEMLTTPTCLASEPKPRGKWPYLRCTSAPYRTAEFRRHRVDRRGCRAGESDEEMQKRYLEHLKWQAEREAITSAAEHLKEQAEREALQWADSPEAQGLGEKAGNEFLKMASVDYETWFWNRIGSMETLESLDSFGERFEKDTLEFEVFRQIADNVQELISDRRALLVKRERHNQKTSEPGAVTPNPL